MARRSKGITVLKEKTYIKERLTMKGLNFSIKKNEVILHDFVAMGFESITIRTTEDGKYVTGLVVNHKNLLSFTENEKNYVFFTDGKFVVNDIDFILSYLSWECRNNPSDKVPDGLQIKRLTKMSVNQVDC